MEGLGSWFSDKVNAVTSTLTGNPVNVPAATEKAIQPIAPTLTTSEGAEQLGMGKERKGYTSGGGRRLAKKTRKRKGGKHGKTHGRKY